MEPRESDTPSLMEALKQSFDRCSRCGCPRAAHKGEGDHEFEKNEADDAR